MGTVNKNIDLYISRSLSYLTQNITLVTTLVTIAVASYGFELFNFNLTIDEEVHAFSSQANRWIEQGRWGMYILNSLLLPQPVIPFVPLFTALIFHLLAIILFLNSWEIESKLEKILIGTIGIAYPGMAYMYTFSTINYGIGVGLFLVALALFVYVRADGVCKFFSVLPGAIAISIYQGFAVALAVAFLVHFIAVEIGTDRRNINIKNLFIIFSIGVLSAATYYAIQKLFLLSNATNIEYVDTFFDIDYLWRNISDVTRNVLDTLLRVYSGSPAIYGSEISILGVIVILSLASLALRLISCNLSIANKILIAPLCLLLLVLPFASGFLMRGTLAMRFLVALPIVFTGLVMLGLHGRSRGIKLFAGMLVGFCVFQFVISTNTLFSSSALALQADRLLAGRVLERIAEAKAIAGAKELKYLEVVGYIDRTPTRLISKSETFGASFFEWDQGNANRVLLFLKTLGYEELQPLPVKGRSEMMDITSMMPIWPDKGSVQVFGDIVLIKFGPYSYVQNRTICEAVKNNKYCN